ncbi:MAG: PH domain-containing protein [Promethearchaeota archaeon]
MLKLNIGFFLIYADWFVIMFFIFIFLFPGESFFLIFFSFIIIPVVLPYIFVILYGNWYVSKFIDRFSFEISRDSVIIRTGVFTRSKIIIPHSRIQNITITNGVFDRMYGLHTVKIETAGFSGTTSGGQGTPSKPEGLIPGVKNAKIIEEKIKKIINKFSKVPSGLGNEVFKPEQIAFDNFIAYILSKIREGERLKTYLKEKREAANLSVSELADKVGVPVETIKLLEEGRYDPSLTLAQEIARVLNCRIEDLFEIK